MASTDGPNRLGEWTAAALSVLALLAVVPLVGGDGAGLDRGFVIAGAAGCAGVAIYWHPFRVLGFVLPAATAFFGAAVFGLVSGHWVGWLLGATAGLSLAAVAGTYRPRTRRDGITALGVAGGAAGGAALVLLAPADRAGEVAVTVTGLLALTAWLGLFRPAFELGVEPVLWVMYRIRAAGPGLAHVPARGPCLVIANHACWFDPLFLAKVFPRPVTPMMTSRFYDLPVLRWLMRRVFRTIRVPDKVLKQDAPEIQEAITALDRGECVVIFPEGYLRRAEEKPLKRFGRGVWQILAARPATPVFTCWIEGGWGSYCSYFNGRPTKNKKPDRRRPVGIGVPDPVRLDPATLEHHLRTRLFLMNRVADARKTLGLPDIPTYELPGQTDGKEDEEE